MLHFKKVKIVFHELVSYCFGNNFFYIMKKANAGNADAQFKLGFLYQYGDGIPLNYEQAIIWYRKAAEQNHREAQFNLGLMHEQGKGVKKDEQLAIFWYNKAAEQGHTTAQISLSLLLYHRKEDGDLALAYSWLSVVASFDSYEIQYRDLLLSLIPPDERETALTLAVFYVRHYGKRD